jgi:hypothetical protein
VLEHRAEVRCPSAYAVDVMLGGEERAAGYDPRVMYSTGGPIHKDMGIKFKNKQA